MDEKTQITFLPTQTNDEDGLPNPAEVVVLFSSTVAFGPGAAPHYRCFYFDASINLDQNTDNSLGLQVSFDKGTTWVANDATATVAISNANADGRNVRSFYVAPYSDWRIVYTNGAVKQGTFQVQMIIDHSQRGVTAIV